jgi:hypothetical protein
VRGELDVLTKENLQNHVWRLSGSNPSDRLWKKRFVYLEFCRRTAKMPELEITEFHKPRRDCAELSFHGSWVLEYYVYGMEDDDSSLGWYTQFVISELLPNNVWKEVLFNTPFMTEDVAEAVTGKLRFGDLLWWGLDQELQLRRRNGETLAITTSWTPVQVAALWDCGRICWAVRDEDALLHLLDSDLQEVNGLNLRDAHSEVQGRFHWAHSRGGVTFFVGTPGKLEKFDQLYSAAYEFQNNAFTDWRLQLVEVNGAGLLLPKTSDYLALVLGWNDGVEYSWTWNAGSFVRGDGSAFLPRNPLDFNRDFSYEYFQSTAEIRGFLGRSTTVFALDRHDEDYENVFIDEHDPGTLWVTHNNLLFRFRFVSDTPSLLQLATRAFAASCLDLIGCDSWKSMFYGSVEKLTANLTARQTTLSPANRQIAYHTRFSRVGE